jgi:hypothetical protein
VISIGKKINNSTIQCPDGQTLLVTVSHGRSQSVDGAIVVIELVDGDGKRYQTWIAAHVHSEAKVAKIIYAAKHSPEFRDSLEVRQVAYPESDLLTALLSQFEKPAFIELSGNLQPAPVHEEIATVINFPDGFPKTLEKHANKAGWLSVRRGGGENRIQVRTNYGNAHAYNRRLEVFLEGVLTNTLKRSAYFHLDLPSASTVVTTFGVKRPVIQVAPEVIAESVQKAIEYPLSQAREALQALKAGRDTWSSMKTPELESQISAETLEMIQRAFKKDKPRLIAYRWHLRGLPAPYAILKATVEMERYLDYVMQAR